MAVRGRLRLEKAGKSLYKQTPEFGLGKHTSWVQKMRQGIPTRKKQHIWEAGV